MGPMAKDPAVPKRQRRTGRPRAADAGRGRLASARRRLALLLARTRLTLALELGAELLWPAVAIWAGYLGLAAAGVWEALPAAAGVAAFAGAVVASAAAVLRRLPRIRGRGRRIDALRRLARANAVAAGELMALADRPVAGEAGLWRLHLARAITRAWTLRAPRPAPGLPADPAGWGAFGLLLLATGLALGRHDAATRMLDALPPPLVHEPADVAITAVILPPAYTRLGPRPVIDGPSGAEAAARRLSVPQASRLAVTVTGGITRPVIEGPAGRVRLAADGAGRFAGDAGITVSGRWRVRQGRRTRLLLHVAVEPDRAPVLAFTGEPAASPSGVLTLTLAAEDDHGLGAGRLRFYADAAARAADRPFASLALHPADAPGRQELVVTADLAADVHAGLPVLVEAEVRDGLGQTAVAGPLTLTLPERRFTNPLAAAIARLRTDLLRHPEQAPLVIAGLEAIRAQRAAFAAHMTAWLGLSAAVWRLRLAPDGPARDEAARLLWQVALDLEDEGLSLAASDMRAALQDLAAAIAGDGDAEAALKAAEAAISRYLARLALEQLKAASGVPLADLAGMMNRGGQVTSRDLSALLEEIRSLLRAGRRDEAARLFAGIRAMLEQAAAHPMTAEDLRRAARMRRTLADLARLERAQAGLHDRTVEAALLASLLAERGIAFDAVPLAREQQELQARLGRILDAMKEAGLDPPPMLPAAGAAMGRAVGALEAGSGARASLHQNDAVDALKAAREALEEAAHGLSMSGSVMPALADPLGRPAATMRGGDLALPKGMDRRSLEALIEAVRRRLADPALDAEGRRYLERLLRTY